MASISIKKVASKTAKAFVKANKGDESIRDTYNLLKEQKCVLQTKISELEAVLENKANATPDFSKFTDFSSVLEWNPRIAKKTSDYEQAYAKSFKNALMDMTAKLSTFAKSIK